MDDDINTRLGDPTDNVYGNDYIQLRKYIGEGRVGDVNAEIMEEIIARREIYVQHVFNELNDEVRVFYSMRMLHSFDDGFVR